MQATGYVAVLVSASGRDEAEKIAAVLLERRKAACVNILPSVVSRYWWKGEIDSAEEVMIIIKTREIAVREVISIVKSNHGYTVPEIIALPIIGGNQEYLDWIGDEVPG